MATNTPFEPESYARPTYFWFFTLMAFHVFLKEKVDIAIIEVGAVSRSYRCSLLYKILIISVNSQGGWADTTNIMPKPLVAAIGSIGMGGLLDKGSPGNTSDLKQPHPRQPTSERSATTPSRLPKTSLVSTNPGVPLSP